MKCPHCSKPGLWTRCAYSKVDDLWSAGCIPKEILTTANDPYDYTTEPPWSDRFHICVHCWETVS